jgi:CheY-like chemotaxis protein
MDNKRPTILIVDDDPIIVDLLSSLLEDDYAIVRAYNGAQALEIIERQALDLILLDLMMPGIDGFTVACRLRELDSSRHTPVLVLSAHSGLQNQAKRMDISGFMIKPFEPEELLSKVAQLV